MTISNEKHVYDDGMVLYKKKCTTRREAIRVFCMECMGIVDRREKYKGNYDVTFVRECTDFDCPLLPFRLGKNPFTRRKGNPSAFQKT